MVLERRPTKLNPTSELERIIQSVSRFIQCQQVPLSLDQREPRSSWLAGWPVERLVLYGGQEV